LEEVLVDSILSFVEELVEEFKVIPVCSFAVRFSYKRVF
jgi:predicted GNAT family acetyltransferase